MVQYRAVAPGHDTSELNWIHELVGDEAAHDGSFQCQFSALMRAQLPSIGQDYYIY
jgi:hypothetical protein